MDVFLGARTHSTIAAWSTLVPTIAVAYSIKAYGLVEYIFSKEDISKYLIDIRKVKFEELKEKTHYLIENNKNIRKETSKSIKAMIKNSNKNILSIKKIIGER